MIARVLTLFINCLWIISVASKRVVIFDTAHKPSLGWTIWTNSISAEDGWTEESVTNVDDGVNTRSYVTCDVNKDNVNNWLRTQFIDLADARRISIELTFTIRDCKLFPHTARTCKETFSLYYYESDLNFASKDKPAWDEHTYKRIDRITADSGRFTNKENYKYNTEIRSVPVTKKGIYFAFRDEGACISLLGIRVFYEVCEETVTNFAWFPETPTGPDLTSIQEAAGHCVDNASPPSGSQPKYFCKADGTWDLLSGGCQCNPGFSADGQRCKTCDVGFYKENPGFGMCQTCPAQSTAKETGTAVCVCDAGYFRAANDPKSMPCTRPPSRPEQPEVVSVDQTSAVIKWNKPINFGGRSDLWYRIECSSCPTGTQYLPARNKFNSTRLTLNNLEPDMVYTVTIFAENDVSSQIHMPMYGHVEIQTKSHSPLSVQHVRIDAVTENQATVSWDPPSTALDYDPLSGQSPGSSSDNVGNPPISGLETELERRKQAVSYYHVKFYLKNRPDNYTTKTTSEPRITLNNLLESSEYFVEIRPFMTKNGPGAWSEPKNLMTAGSTRQPISEGSFEITGLIVAVIVVIALALAVSIYFWRRKYCAPLCSSKQASDLDTLEYKTDQTTITPDYNSAGTLHRKLTTPLVPSFNVSPFKPYVDPTTYEDPNLALKEFANEIDASCVIIEEIIGGGEFGEVCKGQLRVYGMPEITVAIKTLKPGSSEKAKGDFLTEASIMGQFNHANVIKLKGVVTKAEPVMIITEYVENRSLDSFLRVNDGKFDALQLVSMLSSVGQGMKYLSEKGFVHRDLAARNVLVDKQLLCKIADFGLSRGLEGSVEQAYTTKGGKIPVRWTAPEAIAYRKFTSSSDVWSFGVVMWEVMSYGERPYWDWTNQEVIQAIDKGYRLPPPMDCPQALHGLMLDCWHRERQYRPTFSSIVQTLNSFLQCPELLYMSSSSTSISTPMGVSQLGDSMGSLSSSAIAGSRNNSSHHVISPLINRSSSIYGSTSNVEMDDFLRSTGLHDVCSATFRRHGLKNVTELCRLSHGDLASMGFRLEHQMRILEAVQRWQQATLPRRNYNHVTGVAVPANHNNNSNSSSNGVPANHIFSNGNINNTNHNAVKQQHHNNEGFFV